MRSFINHDLTEYNSYRLRAICAHAFFPDFEEELIKIYQQWPATNKILLGNGNNVILSQDYYSCDFIIFNGNFNQVEISGNYISAQAGATLEKLSIFAFENNLSGLEIFYDIPSSVGGAVVMNAGASGEEIKDLIVKVRYLDVSDMSIKEIHCDDIGFEYRNSFFQKNTNKIVLKAWFRLINEDSRAIKAKMEANKQTRWAKQPRDYPNAGSVFKRPKGCFVGEMIEQIGLKGYAIGCAKISEKHSGFIINIGNATGKDVIELIEKIRIMVKEKLGVELELEQKII